MTCCCWKAKGETLNLGEHCQLRNLSLATLLVSIEWQHWCLKILIKLSSHLVCSKCVWANSLLRPSTSMNGSFSALLIVPACWVLRKLQNVLLCWRCSIHTLYMCIVSACMFVCLCVVRMHFTVFTSWETNLWMVFQATRQKKFKHIHQHSTIRWYSSCYIETPPPAPTYVNLRLPSFNHHHLIATTTTSTFTNIQLSPLHSVSCSSASREMAPVVGRNTTSASCSQWQPPWMCKVQGSRPQ